MNAHAPHVAEQHTVTVICALNGPQIQRSDGLRQCATLADVEAFCAELRRLGAAGSAPLREIVSLQATLPARPAVKPQARAKRRGGRASDRDGGDREAADPDGGGPPSAWTAAVAVP